MEQQTLIGRYRAKPRSPRCDRARCSEPGRLKLLVGQARHGTLHLLRRTIRARAGDSLPRSSARARRGTWWENGDDCVICDNRCGVLVPWKRDASHNSRAGHPGWRRCSSLTYAQYARSSRLAIRAPRSGTYATHHASRGLAMSGEGRTGAHGGGGRSKPVRRLRFEIARFPNRFQRRCVGDVRARYVRRSDGRIDVINRCRATDGTVTEARGIARVVDERTSAKLKVRFAPAVLSFLPMVWGDYWIIGLAADYSWAVVGSPDSGCTCGFSLARSGSPPSSSRYFTGHGSRQRLRR